MPIYPLVVSQSKISRSFDLSVLTLGILFLIYSYFFLVNPWLYLLAAIFLMLPLFSRYFVGAQWAGLAKRRSSVSDGTYYVDYQTSQVKFFSGLVGCIFLIMFIYSLVSNGLIAFFVFFPIFWVIEKVIQVIAEFCGRLSSK